MVTMNRTTNSKLTRRKWDEQPFTQYSKGKEEFPTLFTHLKTSKMEINQIYPLVQEI